MGGLQSGAPEDEETAVDEGSTEKEDFPEEALPEEGVVEGAEEGVVEGAEEGPWDESGAGSNAPPADVPEDEFETPEEDPEEVFPEHDVPDGAQEGSGGLPDGVQEDPSTTGSESAEETTDPPTDGLEPPDSSDGAPTGNGRQRRCKHRRRR